MQFLFPHFISKCEEAHVYLPSHSKHREGEFWVGLLNMLASALSCSSVAAIVTQVSIGASLKARKLFSQVGNKFLELRIVNIPIIFTVSSVNLLFKSPWAISHYVSIVEWDGIHNKDESVFDSACHTSPLWLWVICLTLMTLSFLVRNLTFIIYHTQLLAPVHGSEPIICV